MVNVWSSVRAAFILKLLLGSSSGKGFCISSSVFVLSIKFLSYRRPLAHLNGKYTSNHSKIQLHVVTLKCFIISTCAKLYIIILWQNIQWSVTTVYVSEIWSTNYKSYAINTEPWHARCVLYKDITKSIN